MSVRSTGSVPIPPFQEFLDATRSTVYRFLAVAVGPGDADDCFQETYLAALRAYPRLTGGDRLDRWILTIASRKALDHHRRRARGATPVAEPPEIPTGGEPELADDAVWAAVGSLPPRQRVAVVHRHLLDRSYAEIAELMECSEQTARANVSQGVRRLRRLMG